MQPELAYLGQEAAGQTITLATRFQRDGQEIIECRAANGTLLQTVAGPLTSEGTITP